MKHSRLLLLIFIAVVCGNMLWPLQAGAQTASRDSLSLHLFYPSYSFHVPAGDLSKRFGVSHSIGGGYCYLTKSRWIIVAEGNFHFGNQIDNRNSLLSMISTSDGNVIDEGGVFADIAMFERGFSFFAKAGKLFNIAGVNPNSGILVLAGAGFLQHKIRVDVKNNTAPQLRGDYKKGYDHMCNGPAITQFAGYQYLSENRKVNIFGGIECTEAWTQSRRAYYFNEMRRPDENRYDMLIGIKVGWMVPVTGKSRPSYYYY